MDRLRARLTEALKGVQRMPRPEQPAPSGAAVAEDLAQHFEKELVSAQGRLIRVANEAEAQAAIERRADGGGIVRAEDEFSETALREAVVGVDRADLLIAETGTVARSYRSQEAARVTLVPPVAVFVATLDALVRDLPTALTRIEVEHDGDPAYSVLITGPSRTADIEKMLVIPAHGPRELIVILIDGHTA